jgi:serine/threonine-protein kinase
MADEPQHVPSEALARVEPKSSRRQFGRYTLLYRLSAGGMANVFVGRLAGPDGFQRLVAIKLIHEHLTQNEDFVQMFIDEARLVSRISHPNVAQVIELGKVGETYFIAMEYVEGESVSALLRRVEPSRICSVRIISDAAAGLHAAHELRNANGQPLEVVHRDVSPQNILISYEGAVKLIDFGVARTRGNLRTTAAGSVKGKFSYMAPEQTYPGEIDRRADVFCLGIVLYELTTSRRLFKGASDAETLELVRSGEIPPPSKQVPDYPRRLEEIVLRALERDPDKRYQTALEMHQELERFIFGESTDPVLASVVGGMMEAVFPDKIAAKRELLRRCEEASGDEIPDAPGNDTAATLPAVSVPRHWTWLALVGVVLLALAGGLFVWSRGTSPEAPPAAGVSNKAARPETSVEVSRPRESTRPAAPQTVTISISASPRNARVLLDGQPVDNPVRLSRPRGRGEIEALVTAPGHEARRFQVPLDQGGSWIIALKALPAGQQPPRARRNRGARAAAARRGDRPARRAPRETRSKTGHLNDDEVLANPYQE